MFRTLLIPTALAAVSLLSSQLPPEPSSAAVLNPFAGSWSGTFGNGEFTGETTLKISPSGMAKGTAHIESIGYSATIVGIVLSDGHFNLIAINDDTPGGIDITCGDFTISDDHLVTLNWGVAETGCDTPGMWQDLELQ